MRWWAVSSVVICWIGNWNSHSSISTLGIRLQYYWNIKPLIWNSKSRSSTGNILWIHAEVWMQMFFFGITWKFHQIIWFFIHFCPNVSNLHFLIWPGALETTSNVRHSRETVPSDSSSIEFRLCKMYIYIPSCGFYTCDMSQIFSTTRVCHDQSFSTQA